MSSDPRTVGEALRDSLRPGDQIIATEDRRFPKQFSPEGHYSQRVGDILMVNNPRIGNLVGGTGIRGVGPTGLDSKGLGVSFEVGTFRLATPDDPGYMATKDQWHQILQEELSRAHATVRVLRRVVWVCVGAVVALILFS